jgi:hypothetical protein
VRARQGHVPTKAAAINKLRGELQLMAVVARRADVLKKAEHRRRRRPRDRHRDERITGALVIERVFEVRAIPERLHIEAGLELRRSLRLEVGVPWIARDECRNIGSSGRVAAVDQDAARREEDQSLSTARLHTAHAIRAAKTELVEP